MFAGTFTALVTPFRDDRIDVDALRQLIDRQFDQGITGIVPVGTTGESPTLDHDEHKRVIELAIEQAAGRGPVIAGTGSNSTREAIELTRAAEAAGADASLQVCPYYNKPCQEGLYRHYRAIAESTSLPIVLYSIPGRSAIEIGVDTVARLAADCANIVAIKEAGGSVERVTQIRAVVPAGFQILSGDDALTLPFMAAGACGVVSVASNLVPEVMSRLVTAALGGDWAQALQLHDRWAPLLSGLLKLSSNPVPIKAALALLGHMQADVRLPLAGLNEEKTGQLRRILGDCGIS
jgi:4-hydroxy-tetrahydrodipicolinate synthase